MTQKTFFSYLLVGVVKFNTKFIKDTTKIKFI